MSKLTGKRTPSIGDPDMEGMEYRKEWELHNILGVQRRNFKQVPRTGMLIIMGTGSDPDQNDSFKELWGGDTI